MTSCVTEAVTGEVTVVGCDQGREVMSMCKLVCCKGAETLVVGVSVSVSVSDRATLITGIVA